MMTLEALWLTINFNNFVRNIWPYIGQTLFDSYSEQLAQIWQKHFFTSLSLSLSLSGRDEVCCVINFYIHCNNLVY